MPVVGRVEGIPSLELKVSDASTESEYSQIYVGTLVKYVNFGKGWRHRLCVLQAGVLRYYKVYGPSAINAYSLLENLRQQGEVIKIGSEIEISEHKWKSRTTSTDLARPIPAAGDIHLQVSSIRPSESDYRKFYVNTGTMELRFKADNKDDRWAWLQALKRAKATWEGLSPMQASTLSLFASNDSKAKQEEGEFVGQIQQIQENLKQRGASQEIGEYVQDLLMAQHKTYQGKLTQQLSKIKALMDAVNELESLKRQLQTALIVEQREKQHHPLRHDSYNGNVSELDSDNLSDDVEGPTVGNALSDDEEFWDCESAERTSSNFSEAMERTVSIPSTSEPEWIKAEQPFPQRRSSMPKFRQNEKSYSLWSIIKECIGKDLSKVCLPVYFNEPLSALQKSAEDLEYCDLLDKAAEFPVGSYERLIHVACFAVSGYASTANRTSKPFNPLLGETYEFVCPEKGFRFISEKVVHHPTIMAAYCEGRKWHAIGDGELRSKFTGPSIQLCPVGVFHLSFNDGEDFTWHKVTTSVNNIIVGRLNIDHGGVMHVKSLQHGLTAKMKFKQAGLLNFRAEVHQVEGSIEKGQNVLSLPKIEGKWDESLTAIMANGERQIIWKKSPPAENPTRHNWGSWVMKLNEMTPGLREKLAPTDCRLRPDQHYMEIGEFDKANEEKLRLEQKQRAARKAAEEGSTLEPRWFERVPGVKPGEAPTYRYKGGYWEARASGKFEGCRDIFSDNPVVVNGKTYNAPKLELKSSKSSK